MDNQINLLKQEIKDARRRYRVEKRRVKQSEQAISLQKQVNQDEPISSRISYQLDEITLWLCRPFEKKAGEIRYKRTNPSGYEADKLIETIVPIVGHFERKSGKGKKLTARDTSLLGKIKMSLDIIQTEGLGTRQEEVNRALTSIGLLLSEEPQLEELNGLLENINQLGQMVQQITGQQIQPLKVSV